MILRPLLRRTLAKNNVFAMSRPIIADSRYNSSFSELPSQSESARSNLSKSLTARIDKLQTSILFAGKRLNDLTGYSGIEKLKQQIEQQEAEVADSVAAVKDAKQAYAEAIKIRSESQREVNELLQRKSSWSGTDLERFTTLFRNDHSNSQNEESRQKDLANAEIRADQARTDLGNMILARYHEEQIWSDKIRRASTWGTWGLMGFNIVLFILVQLGLEPWKRRRLVGSFEDKVRQVVQEERNARLAAGDSAKINEDARYLTDADHAAESVAASVTQMVQAEPPTDLSQSMSRDETHVSTPPDAETSQVDSLHDATLQTRAGTSAMLSLPTSLPMLKSTLVTLWSALSWNILLASSHLTLAWNKIFSKELCHMRVEDVTSACFASGLLGVALGLAI